MKKLLVLLVFITGIGLIGCSRDSSSFQGVTDTTIKVGNTASTSGAFNQIGIPFRQAIEAVIDAYNRGEIGKGLINGRKIEFIHHDDKSSSEGGQAGFEKLVHEDKIFALVGHFGTWTVAPTVDTIKEMGIPMVHAATGTNQLYFEHTPGNSVMAIQPIYKTDGRVMTARAATWPVFGKDKNEPLPDDAIVGVVYSNDDAGKSIVAGVDQQLIEFKNNGKRFTILREQLNEGQASTIAEKVKTADVIIMASNQKLFEAFVSALHDKNIGVPIFTSYVNADIKHVKQNESNVGEIFMNGWYKTEDAPEYVEFRKIIDNSEKLSDAEKEDLKQSTHAKSGYIAARSFIEGLRRVGNKELNWKNFVAAMEEAPIDLLIAGYVDYRNGQRIGTDTMSLWQYNRRNHSIETVDTLKSIPQIVSGN